MAGETLSLLCVVVAVQKEGGGAAYCVATSPCSFAPPVLVWGDKFAGEVGDSILALEGRACEQTGTHREDIVLLEGGKSVK